MFFGHCSDTLSTRGNTVATTRGRENYHKSSKRTSENPDFLIIIIIIGRCALVMCSTKRVSSESMDASVKRVRPSSSSPLMQTPSRVPWSDRGTQRINVRAGRAKHYAPNGRIRNNLIRNPVTWRGNRCQLAIPRCTEAGGHRGGLKVEFLRKTIGRGEANPHG